MATFKCLVTHILQNIFCVQQKKEIHTGLEHDGILDELFL